jgi:hypothetical protein
MGKWKHSTYSSTLWLFYRRDQVWDRTDTTVGVEFVEWKHFWARSKSKSLKTAAGHYTETYRLKTKNKEMLQQT